MNGSKLRLYLIGALGLAVLGLGAAAVITAARLPQPPTQTASGRADIGGPFRMTDQDGRAVTEADYLGKPTAMFFGFTYCPDVCPATLVELTAWLQALGPAADRLNVVFVSVDPERDTPQQLKTYLSAFDQRIQGLSGTPEATEAMAKAYKAFYRKTPLEGGGYTVDHTSMVYLFDARGEFVEPIGYGEDAERALGKLKALVGG